MDEQASQWQNPRGEWEMAKRLRGENRQDLFRLQQSTVCGESPLTVGYIVTLNDPRSQIWFSSGYGLVQSFKAAETAIFNQVYPFGGYTGYVRVIDSQKNWQEQLFKVCVDEPPRRSLLTNFSQTKAAGHVAVGASQGLDVSFTVATSGPVEQIIWNFGDGGKGSGAETSYTYKSARAEPFEGTVSVFGAAKEESRSFKVIMKEFKMRKSTKSPITGHNAYSSFSVF